MLKIWGRNTSSNVQKVMWAVGEIGLEHQRFDIGGNFGKNRDHAYLAMNPNGLVPTLQDGDFILWESNAIVRYLAREYSAGKLEPADSKVRARANQWMDWQLSVVGPAITPAFWGLIRTPQEKRDPAADFAGNDQVGKEARVSEALEVTDGPGNCESKDFEQEAVGQKQNPEADAKQQCSVGGGPGIDHGFLLCL